MLSSTPLKTCEQILRSVQETCPVFSPKKSNPSDPCVLYMYIYIYTYSFFTRKIKHPPWIGKYIRSVRPMPWESVGFRTGSHRPGYLNSVLQVLPTVGVGAFF